MGSTCRDRTSEFRSLSQTLRKIGGGGGSQAAGPIGAGVAPPTTSQPVGFTRSEFNKKASRIGLGIHEASQKIARLTKLAKKSSMFDDPTIEIQQPTALIKDDITAMKTALQDLQTLQNLEMSDGRYSEDKAVHYTTVCDDLKGRLLGTTKQLQGVLTTRTRNVKAHESRKQMFSANVSRENQFRQQTNHLTVPPSWSTTSNEPGNSPPTALPSNGSQVGGQLRRRLAVENTPSHQMEVPMLQQMAPQQDTYSQSCATALHSVESTIAELGGIFTHFASMVAQQGDVAIRIDDNMEEALANVEGARSALLRHLKSDIIKQVAHDKNIFHLVVFPDDFYLLLSLIGLHDARASEKNAMYILYKCPDLLSLYKFDVLVILDIVEKRIADRRLIQTDALC